MSKYTGCNESNMQRELIALDAYNLGKAQNLELIE